MDFSHLFNDPFLSDFQLALVTPDGVNLATYFVHGVVLAGQSPYFKALLQNWVPKDRRSLDIQVSDDEKEAAVHMLQCAYAGTMPLEVTAEQLLSCMILADR